MASGSRPPKKPLLAGTQDSATPEPPQRNSNLQTITVAVALAIVIRIAIFELFEIEGPSMEPTLLNGDRVVVAKFAYGLFLPFATEALVSWGSPKIGEIVIVKSPDGNVDIVKRVIGVAGDVIELRDDVVYRNGELVSVELLEPCASDQQLNYSQRCRWYKETNKHQSWRISRDDNLTPETHRPVRVPDGAVYVLGDHRDRSNDSRRIGPIDQRRVKGRALMIYWSSDHGWWWDDSYVFRSGRLFTWIR